MRLFDRNNRRRYNFDFDDTGVTDFGVNDFGVKTSGELAPELEPERGICESASL